MRGSIAHNARLHESIAALDPPLYAANSTSKTHTVGGQNENPALRRSHLDNLITVMHRCLLEGDYDRAARAWGLLLRTQVAGRRLEPLNPRNHGRWGIGAELLLRRGVPTQHVSTARNRDEMNQGSAGSETQPVDASDADDVYTELGLGLAREYYERFIIQYPYRKSAPDAVDSRIFYPPLFTTWIMEIRDQSSRARKRRQRKAEDDDNDDDVDENGDPYPLESEIQARELSSARELCDRLDQLLISPPFDKHTELLYLRGNVGLWLSDLIVGRKPAAQQSNEDWDMDMSSDDHSSSNLNSIDEHADKSARYRNSLRELDLARDFFVRAEANGAGDLESIKSGIDIRVKSLGKQMARFDD